MDLGHGYRPPPGNHARDVGAVDAKVNHIIDKVNYFDDIVKLLATGWLHHGDVALAAGTRRLRLPPGS
jgi:hypothetical protein